MKQFVEKPSVTVLIHRAFTRNGSNGWGTALYEGYRNSILDSTHNLVRIVSAPSTATPNINKDRIFYNSVDCDPALFPSAKASAVDVYLWDAIHLIAPKNEAPFVVQDFEGNFEKYQKSWRDFFEYSIHAGRRALQLAQDDANPIFHLNDPHDCFVSALFEGNYDRSWLNSLGLESQLDQFELAKYKFKEKHGQIKHMRFWHTPNVDVEVFKKWYEKDQFTAMHVAAGIFSSPLIVHTPQWKEGTEKLADFVVPQICQYLEKSQEDIFKGIGIGPIGYDRSVFSKRFTFYDPHGEFRRVPDVLGKWSSEIKAEVGNREPIVFFITCRGDDPKNNVPTSLKAIHDFALANPQAREQMALIIVYSTSRKDEHHIYSDTLESLSVEKARLVELLGEKRVIEAITKNGDLTYQTAGFLLSNMFVCSARGGFDIVGVEASIVAALKAKGEIAPQYKDILAANGFSNDFHLVLAQSAGATSFLRAITPNITMIETNDYLLPSASQVTKEIANAWNKVVRKTSEISDPQAFLDALEDLCSGPECIEQWTSAAVRGRPETHPRTLKNIELVKRVTQPILENR